MSEFHAVSRMLFEIQYHQCRHADGRDRTREKTNDCGGGHAYELTEIMTSQSADDS